MIAFAELFPLDATNQTANANAKPNANLVPALQALNLLHIYNPDDPTPFTRDFGGTHHSIPAAVLRPTTPDEVSLVVRLATTSRFLLTVTPRGNGHAVSGQSMANATGILLDMSGFRNVDVSSSGDSLIVGGGALWEHVLARAVEVGKGPRSWTDYLGLSVGGTLSNGGLSGQAFRFGPQTENVEELEVVTGNGEVVVCSQEVNSDLFFGVLGGLGQFGVITRARIPIFPVPDMVRWIRLVYSDLDKYTADAEMLVSRDDPVDYVEGFVFLNSDDPVNGWDTVPFSPDQRFDTSRIPPGSGSVLYCLELVIHYKYSHRCNDEGPSVDERTRKLLGELRHVRGLEFCTDVSYVEFMTRVKHVEDDSKANGTWDAPHPWLNLLISSKNIIDFDSNVFGKILKNGIDGPMLLYPLLKSKWDPRTSLETPESDIFYLVALLRFCRPFPDGRLVKELISENQEIIDYCVANGYDFKVYIPHYKDEAKWKHHFGNQWSRFVQRKERYDPMAILAPGQDIFPRAPGLL